jgi:transcriptional regulator with XRE-family HTH domain
VGRARIDRPRNLSKKLIKIRETLVFSQNELIAALGLTDVLTQAEISAFEREKRLPSLVVLLRYARLFKIHVDDLIDDEIDI